MESLRCLLWFQFWLSLFIMFQKKYKVKSLNHDENIKTLSYNITIKYITLRKPNSILIQLKFLPFYLFTQSISFYKSLYYLALILSWRVVSSLMLDTPKSSVAI